MRNNSLQNRWFTQKKWKPFGFQLDTWSAFKQEKSGFLNAPTGSGKTLAIWFGVLENYYFNPSPKKGLHTLYITPLRALSKEILIATQQVSIDLALSYTVALKTGDTPMQDRKNIYKNSPHALITTPESLHIMLTQKNYENFFESLEYIIVDEWHELLGTKRGVQTELAILRIKNTAKKCKLWCISATIGNLEQAAHVLLKNFENNCIIKSNLDKKISLHTLLPNSINTYSWAGHLGIKMLQNVMGVIIKYSTTLIFTNTRSQAEIWYQKIVTEYPDLVGQVALHHSSLDLETRHWVENQLKTRNLKVVICTSSLDLGVDFPSVDAIVQIGSPKGIARFMQRAGRSGHSPNSESTIYFVPTHSLEIIEAVALKDAIENKYIEHKVPLVRCFDVLIQYLITLAVSDGFCAQELFLEIKKTHCFESITLEEFNWCLQFIVEGGKSLNVYDEFKKVEFENGKYLVKNKRQIIRHKLSIGTIVSDSMMQVKYINGKKIGFIEEWFISKLNKGDCFWFSGRNLEIQNIHIQEVLVKNTSKKAGIVPAWMGGRIPLSSNLSESIKTVLKKIEQQDCLTPECTFLQPLLLLQKQYSYWPAEQDLLIEEYKDKEGYHLFIYPFEGRFIHEGLACVLAYRISKLTPITFSMAMNDYGFELLSDVPFSHFIHNNLEIFSPKNLFHDLEQSIHLTEMCQRKFRDISTISGLVFQGYPGKNITNKHLQGSAQLFYKVFTEYDPHNLLTKQAKEEVLFQQMEITRLQKVLHQISKKNIIFKNISRYTPFSFPIMVDRLRERLSTEDLDTRIQKILSSYAKN